MNNPEDTTAFEDNQEEVEDANELEETQHTERAENANDIENIQDVDEAEHIDETEDNMNDDQTLEKMEQDEDLQVLLGEQGNLLEDEDRTEATLLACIKEWIMPGTTIISDCWKSYNCLNSEGFQHLTVNHSYNFVDPDTGAHTQHIERVWREVRANIGYGTRANHVEGYLFEFLFKRAHPRAERIEIFFDVIAKMYPPMSIAESQLDLPVEEDVVLENVIIDI
ncbi:putative transposase-like protein [Lasius niger]|uniref:Putative transposase-like protein n=1 Tax=Lasius niger TaxID=67767 RepID=A0A0J7NA66_LASNI|nr:putative transposase-like protein [Lasius niger]KMQ89515.1 putative transposase-like protein [Lasius niger]